MNNRRTLKAQRAGVAYLFLALPLLLLCVYLLYPTIKTIWMSFFNWDSFSSKTPEFMGVENYKELLSSIKFKNALKNNLIYTACVVVSTVVVGMLLAVPIDRGIWGWKWFKFAFYVPCMLSVTVVSVLFKYILDPNIGFLNEILCKIGLESFALNWLTDPDIALWTILFVTTWQYSGTTMLLFLAAMSSIPQEVHEAATLDGVNEIQRFFKITLPIIKRPTLVVVMLQLIYGFKTYDIIAVMTNGGPGTATQVLSLLVTQSAFKIGNYGLACATAVVMIVLVSIVSVFYVRQTKLGDQVIE